MPGMDGFVDGRSRKAANFEKVAAFRLELRHLFDFLLTHVLEVDDDTPGAGLGDDAVEGHDNDPGIAGLLNSAVESIGRRGVDDDRVVALKDKVLDLGGLGGHLLVGRCEDVGSSDDSYRQPLSW